MGIPGKLPGNYPETMQKTPETMEKPVENPLILAENPEKPKKNLGGRPKKTAEEKQLSQENKAIQDLIDKYLSGRDKINWTIAGMAKAVGCKSSRQFIDLAKERGGAYSYGLLRMEEKGEEFLFTKCYPGAIFLLKQLGWEDTQHIETENKSVSINVNLAVTLDDLAKVLNPVVEENVI